MGECCCDGNSVGGRQVVELSCILYLLSGLPHADCGVLPGTEKSRPNRVRASLGQGCDASSMREEGFDAGRRCAAVQSSLCQQLMYRVLTDRICRWRR